MNYDAPTAETKRGLFLTKKEPTVINICYDD